jgi:hypothetical protein
VPTRFACSAVTTVWAADSSRFIACWGIGGPCDLFTLTRRVSEGDVCTTQRLKVAFTLRVTATLLVPRLRVGLERQRSPPAVVRQIANVTNRSAGAGAEGRIGYRSRPPLAALRQMRTSFGWAARRLQCSVLLAYVTQAPGVLDSLHVCTRSGAVSHHGGFRR